MAFAVEELRHPDLKSAERKGHRGHAEGGGQEMQRVTESLQAEVVSAVPHVLGIILCRDIELSARPAL